MKHFNGNLGYHLLFLEVYIQNCIKAYIPFRFINQTNVHLTYFSCSYFLLIGEFKAIDYLLNDICYFVTVILLFCNFFRYKSTSSTMRTGRQAILLRQSRSDAGGHCRRRVSGVRHVRERHLRHQDRYDPSDHQRGQDGNIRCRAASE